MPTQLPRVPSLIPSSFATLAIGRDVSITIFTASSLNSGEKLFFGRGNYFTFPDVHPIGWTVRKARGTSITGWSMCGESVIRAAACEHRLAAVVADPGVLDAWQAFPPFLQKIFAGAAPKAEVNRIWRTDIVPALTAAERFTFAKRSELFGPQYLAAGRAGRVLTDVYDLGRTIMQVN